MPYENFPTPADIAPEEFKKPDLDPTWEALMMTEIAKLLADKKPDLIEHKHVRFYPAPRRDNGHCLIQWKYYAHHIADLVRKSGWVVMIGENSMALPTLTIQLPHQTMQPPRRKGR